MSAVNSTIRVISRMSLVLGYLYCWPLTAQTFTVNTTADTEDDDLTNNICADKFGQCSLRAAIQSANQLHGDDTVVLGKYTYKLTIAGDSEQLSKTGDLDITDNLFIQGAGAAYTIVDAGQLDRVFDISNSAVVSMKSLTIRNGRTPGNGAGIQLMSGTKLDISDCIVTDNNTEALGSSGGGIFGFDAVINISNCTIINNSTTGYGGGFANYTFGTTSISDSTITGNRANMGGGFMNSFKSKAVIKNTVIFDNKAALGGGIITLFGMGNLQFINSTLSGNQSSAGSGGMASYGDTVEIINSTIANNKSAQYTGAISSGGTVRISNSIIANNYNVNSGVVQNCDGTILSQGYNLLGDNTGCNFIAAQGDLTGTAIQPINPLLAPLADNGGASLTHGLLSNSPAIDAGSLLTPGSGGNACEMTDQRQVVRIGRGACDIGAFEATGGGDVWVSAVNAADVKPGPTLIQQNITVGNKGPNKVSNLSLAINLPISSENVTINGDAWLCTPDTDISATHCNRLALDSQSESSLVLQFKPPIDTREIITRLNITTVSDDPITSNNKMDLTTIINQAPSVTTQTSINYKINKPSEHIAPQAIINDEDDNFLAGARIQFSQGYHADEDDLYWQGNARILAQWQPEIATLLLTGEDTIGAYEQALREVVYENRAATANTNSRSITITVSDAYADSAPATIVVAMIKTDNNSAAATTTGNTSNPFDTTDAALGGDNSTKNNLVQPTRSTTASGKWMKIWMLFGRQDNQNSATVDDLVANADGTSLWQVIGEMKYDAAWISLDKTAINKNRSMTSATALGSGAVFIAGFVHLFVRSGGLLGFLFSFPVWNTIDPIPVILISKKEQLRRINKERKERRRENNNRKIGILLDDK